MTSIELPYKGRRQRGATPVSHGLHRPTEEQSTLGAWRLVLPPSGRFSSLTAAALYGWWLPPLPEGLPVLAALQEDESRPQRQGLVASRHRELPDPRTINGLPVDPPAEALLACARHLGLVDMVVLLDAALHGGSCGMDELRDAAYRHRRGGPMMRRALRHVDHRAESPWETLLRLFHESVGADVESQYELRDADGVFVARADLRVVGTTSLHEYDGADHLDRRRQRKDLQRDRRIGNVTWTRRGYTSADLLNQAVTVLRDIDIALGRAHQPSRVRLWHRWLADSCFTTSGQERLRRRFGLTAVGAVQPLPRIGIGGDAGARTA